MLRCPNMDGANFKNTLKILDFSKESRWETYPEEKIFTRARGRVRVNEFSAKQGWFVNRWFIQLCLILAEGYVATVNCLFIITFFKGEGKKGTYERWLNVGYFWRIDLSEILKTKQERCRQRRCLYRSCNFKYKLIVTPIYYLFWISKDWIRN